jgi:nitroimidazol reductase NimA-like FMN-containing flavoprotein (pyridoxamine 5'-phosphate oxidase superfamily)
MLGKLTSTQINNILSSQSVCRLACTDGKKPYVVPVTYAYDGKFIYGQTQEGTKLNILRKNPHVCLQMDIMNSMNNWQSVMVQGTFEELKNKAADTAREYLFSKVLTLMTSSTIHNFEHENASKVDDSNRIKTIMYRIKIKEVTGRFERQ